MNRSLHTRRHFLKAVGIGAAGAAAGCHVPPTPPRERVELRTRPNILYIMADDHACNAIGCYGGIVTRLAETPHIDRIAAEGARLDSCFVTNSICTPSRATILTGQYSHANGVYTLGDELNPRTTHAGTMLQQAGYQTAVVGKWHLKSEPAGFDYWCVLPGQGRYHDPVMNEVGIGSRTFKGRHSTDVITDLSLTWLSRRDKSKPFFLLCHFKAPHRPWEPARRFADTFKDVTLPEPENLQDEYADRSQAAANARLTLDRDMNERDLKTKIPEGRSRRELRSWAYQLYIKDYLRCVAGIDENVGRLLTALDEEGLTKDTVVIYTSDQGFFLGEHGYFDKRFMYEESIRMPFLIRYPREIKPGTALSDIIINADFAPLFLDYAGVQPPDTMQGRSFRLHLLGSPPPDWRRSMYYRYWMHMADHGVPAHYGVRTDRYKLIFYYGLGLGKAGTEKFGATEPEWELFDLAKDPREMRSVYKDPAYAAAVGSLKAELLHLKEALGDTDADYPELMDARGHYWD